MGLEQILVIAMFAAFMGLLLLGFPVVWSLAGVGLVFAVTGHALVEYFDANLWFTGAAPSAYSMRASTA